MKKREAGQGSLFKRNDGRWEGRVVIGYNEQNKPITKRVTSKDKSVALNAAKHIIDTADMEAWQCFVENSDNIFDFIKQNLRYYFRHSV